MTGTAGRGLEDPPPLQQNRALFASEGGRPLHRQGADLQGFTPARTHLSLREVYGDFPHHNDGTHLVGGYRDNATWQSRWRQLAVHSASWYSTPSGKVGCRFTAVLAAEWRGFLDRNWNSEIRLIFAHVSLTKTLGARKSREIREMIDLRLDLRWGGALVEGRA